MRKHFTRPVKQAPIFTIQTQPSAFRIILNVDSSKSLFKFIEDNLTSTFYVGHPVINLVRCGAQHLIQYVILDMAEGLSRNYKCLAILKLHLKIVF